MSRRLHVAHQFDAGWHDWLRSRLPAGARLDRLPADQPWALPKGVNVLLVANGKLRTLTRTTPPWAADLEWVHMRPAGVDEAPEWLFDVPCVTVSRGAAAVAIAEYVLAAIIGFEKGLHALKVSDPAQWTARSSGSVAGRSVGLVGIGEIGRAVAERAQAFGMTVRATRRRPDPGPRDVELVSLRRLCELSDHLVLCAPLTAETRSLFDSVTFSHCRDGQHLINVARGGLIVPEALRAALDGPISRATLDVWTEEPPPSGHWLYSHPRVHLTPHCSFRGPSTETRLRQILENNLTAWLGGRPMEMVGTVCRDLRY